MHILSVNVGLPRSVEWGGRTITTGIFKRPVEGPVSLEPLNFVGDRQADLTVHGGPDKAVYAYDNTHYAHWLQQIERNDWAPGFFGENLTTEGLLESEVRIGDLFRVGSALLRAVQPRFPCYKLNVRFDDPGMTRHFAREGRSGIYFRVVEPGTVQAGDEVNLIEAADTPITIQTVSQIVLTHKVDADLLASVVALPHLPDSLKRMFGH
ncbi:MOSC domain-containing protein [Spirosoma sp. HMF3257]|uniref:MOSC domain-containing protein n=1 Tax=Spirosoma telluris TaxID=2183553 RepID=A0A327NFJ6_9BACT|nr:MOSC domain-containing protein [Spirosoma telluris]RAI73573.1 MOSC domain-containing protein [Spirosoma telluris]